jgi:hypothetical protein
MMSNDPVFETETMAELCAKQGRLSEAAAIYRRLLESHPTAAARPRWKQRLESLEGAGGLTEITPIDIPLPPAPGVTVAANDEGVTVAWALPAGTPEPTLELFLVQKTPVGIETQTRTLPLATPSGRLAFPAPALHTALAAVGPTKPHRFVPLARGGTGSLPQVRENKEPLAQGAHLRSTPGQRQGR